MSRIDRSDDKDNKMLGAIIAIVAGLSIRRLWPAGLLFLILWPAVAVGIMLPIVARNRAALGETLDLNPLTLSISYAQTALIAGIIFFVTYGIRQVVSRRSRPESV